MMGFLPLRLMAFLYAIPTELRGFQPGMAGNQEYGCQQGCVVQPAR